MGRPPSSSKSTDARPVNSPSPFSPTLQPPEHIQLVVAPSGNVTAQRRKKTIPSPGDHQASSSAA
eukprot:2691273-Rhodomonas_salina.2